MENFYAKSKSRLILMNAINYLGGNKQGTAEFFKATGILQAQKKKTQTFMQIFSQSLALVK